MHPVNFEGAVEIKKPADMTDEQCTSIWAERGFKTLYKIFNNRVVIPPAFLAGYDENQYPYFLTAWQPNREDLEALNRGEPIYIKTVSNGLPPMAVFTLDENGNGNF